LIIEQRNMKMARICIFRVNLKLSTLKNCWN